MELKWKKLDEKAKKPTKGHPGDAGIDFFSLEKIIFPPFGQMRVKTGIALEIPEGCVGLIWDKSGISFNQGLKVMGGVIDAGYRGEIIISLYNTTNTEQIIEEGNKVAQMIIQEFKDCDLVEIKEMSETIRGLGKEGSTGVS